MGFSGKMLFLLLIMLANEALASSEKGDLRQMYEPSAFDFLSRQLSNGLETLGEMLVLGLFGIPVLGLLTVGGLSMANFLGLNLARLGGAQSTTSKRERRDLAERAGRALVYARNLVDVLATLENAFEKYNILDPQCKLRAMCEVHRDNGEMGEFGESVASAMRMQKELESTEVLPFSRFILSNYVNAANQGIKRSDCAQLYSQCSHPTSQFIRTASEDAQDRLQQEV